MERIEAIKRLCKLARKGDRKGLKDVLVGVPKETRRGLLLGLTKEAALAAALAANTTSADSPGTRNIFYNALEFDPYIPLHAAAEFGRKDVLEYMIKRGGIKPVDLDMKDVDGQQTALHKAATYGQEDCVEYLIEMTATAAIQDLFGNTPLHCAAKERQVGCMQRLLQGDRDGMLLHLENKSHEIALHVAARWDEGNLECLKLLTEKENEAAIAAQKEKKKKTSSGGNLCSKLYSRCFEEKTDHKFLNHRNVDGYTPAHVAAAAFRETALDHLVFACGAVYKDGVLNSSDRRNRNLIMLFLATLMFVFTAFFGLYAYPRFQKDDASTTNDIFAQDCVVLQGGVQNCHQCQYTYYLGMVLEPNVFLFSGVFVFKLVQYAMEKEIIPAIDFLFFYSTVDVSKKGAVLFQRGLSSIGDALSLVVESAKRHSGARASQKSRQPISDTSDTSGTNDGFDHDASTTASQSRLDIVAGADAEASAGGGLSIKHSANSGPTDELDEPGSEQDSRKDNGFGNTSGTNGSSTEVTESANGQEKDQTSKEKKSAPFGYKFFFRGDKNLEILTRWRKDKYVVALYNKPDYHGPKFASQPQLIFLYVQTLWSIVSIGLVLKSVSASKAVWMRQETKMTVSNRLLQYTNFYGGVINSSALNTVFSLFKLCVLDGRWHQITTAYKNLSPFLAVAWPLFVWTPTIFLTPPILSHCIPGFVMFIWIFIPFFLTWLVLRRIYCLLYLSPSQLLQSRVSALAEDKIDQILLATGRCLKVFLEERLDIKVTDPLMKSLYWFFLEIFTRFMFIFMGQLAYDYASVSFLGHDSGKYKKAFMRVYKWRSQPQCYLEQATRGYGVVSLLNFL